MTRRLAIVAILASVAAAVAVLVTALGEEPYRVRAEFDNAGGLYEGSAVRIGDLPAGKVATLELGNGDRAVAELELGDGAAPVGAGTSAAVRSLNLFGQKFVALDPGDISRPQPSGVVIPRERTSVSVDLDELLSVLDRDTRARLAVLINEAGLGLLGRRADFNALLQRLPPSLDAAARMLSEFAADNRALGQLVDRGETLFARIADERRALGEFVATAGEAMRTASAKREQLGETLERAPGTLAALRGFLTELRSTTEPLGPAASLLAVSAPRLASMLAAIEPFERAARPALDQAPALAPRLLRLGREATPVIRRASPTMRALARFAVAARPFSETVDVSIDDLLGGVHGMARSLQERDALGHYWRDRVIWGSEYLKSLVSLLAPPARERATEPRAKRRSASRREGRSAPGGEPGAARERLGRLPREALGERPDLQRTLPEPPEAELERLLDFLLKP